MNYWLMKSEPHKFSIDDLKTSEEQKTHWDGVRNYQARNFMRDEMAKKDKVLFYHSSCDIPGIAGVAEVCSDEPLDDFTALDKKSNYFDPKSSKEKNRWQMVQIKFKKKFKQVVALQTLKEFPELSEMRLLQKGNRLSIIPVSKDEFEFIVSLSK
ncbi:EVE domain-containing protein [Bacteriovoracaceae bacterium]|nr:EVE domain-containing protein [Bacteriovoracaceae bacterium]